MYDEQLGDLRVDIEVKAKITQNLVFRFSGFQQIYIYT